MPFGGESAEGYYDEGLTASLRGELDQAIASFQKAIQLDPHYYAARHQLAKCMMRIGQPRQAVELLETVRRARPNQAAVLADLGNALLALDMPSEAYQQFSDAITAEPDNSRALLGLAEVAFSEGKWAAAQDLARQSLLHGGPNIRALVLLGRTARLNSDMENWRAALEEADNLLQKALELNTSQPENYFMRGEVAFARDQFSTALQYYRDAADRCVENRYYAAHGEMFTICDAMARQGLCFLRLDKPDRARELGEQVLRRNPNHVLGKSLLEQK